MAPPVQVVPISMPNVCCAPHQHATNVPVDSLSTGLSVPAAKLLFLAASYVPAILTVWFVVIDIFLMAVIVQSVPGLA